MKRKGLILAHIESFKKVKFPIFIKNILIECAYDTAAALRTINNATILELEKFANKRLDLLKNTNYIDNTGKLKSDPFKFLPGHEAVILQLSVDIDEFLTEKENKIIPEIDTLKKSITEKINNIVSKKNFTINSAFVTGFTELNNKVKCFVKCPICSKKFSCTFHKSWKLSNYKTHFNSCKKPPLNIPQNPTIHRATSAAVLLQLKATLPYVYM